MFTLSLSVSTTDLSGGFDTGVSYLRKSPDQYSSRGSMESLDPPQPSQLHSAARHHHQLGHAHSGPHPAYSSCHQLSSARLKKTVTYQLLLSEFVKHRDGFGKGQKVIHQHLQSCRNWTTLNEKCKSIVSQNVEKWKNLQSLILYLLLYCTWCHSQAWPHGSGTFESTIVKYSGILNSIAARA